MRNLDTLARILGHKDFKMTRGSASLYQTSPIGSEWTVLRHDATDHF